MSNIGITLTGADTQTPIDRLIRLADLGAEIGVLYTFSPDGRHRYPPLSWIYDAAQALSGRAALHICGSRARAAFMRGELYLLLKWVARVQVNGRLTPAELQTICDGNPDKTIITQHTDYNACLLGLSLTNHALLVDASGGRAKLPDSWNRPKTDKAVGFAGGLGPSTLRKELPKIAAVASGASWVDMEGRLRNADDWFDVSRAMDVLGVWRAYQMVTASASPQAPVAIAPPQTSTIDPNRFAQ